MQKDEKKIIELDFSEQDYKQISEQGIAIEKIQKQIHYYKKL